jgi:hypothetical protein
MRVLVVEDEPYLAEAILWGSELGIRRLTGCLGGLF